MKSRRRYLTFSLRTLFVLLTALAVWLGVVVNRAHQEREAVKAIQAISGKCIYYWELEQYFDLVKKSPGGSTWLRRTIGDDFFDDVAVVYFASERDCIEGIPHLQRLRRLKFVTVYSQTPRETQNRLTAMSPGITFNATSYGGPSGFDPR